MKRYSFIVPLLALGVLVAACNEKGGSTAQPAVPLDNIESLFDETFQAKTVEIVSKAQAEAKNLPFAVVRNSNKKLVLMT